MLLFSFQSFENLTKMLLEFMQVRIKGGAIRQLMPGVRLGLDQLGDGHLLQGNGFEQIICQFSRLELMLQNASPPLLQLGGVVALERPRLFFSI